MKQLHDYDKTPPKLLFVMWARLCRHRRDFIWSVVKVHNNAFRPSCVYYERQTREMYKVLPYSKISKKPGKIKIPLRIAILSKYRFISNKGPVDIWNDAKTWKQLVRWTFKCFVFFAIFLDWHSSGFVADKILKPLLDGNDFTVFIQRNDIELIVCCYLGLHRDWLTNGRCFSDGIFNTFAKRKFYLFKSCWSYSQCSNRWYSQRWIRSCFGVDQVTR